MRDISKLQARAPGNGMTVLVAAAREVDEQDRLLRQGARELGGMGERVRGFKSWDDALATAQFVKCVERFVVGHRDIFGAPAVLEPRVLRADAGVVEPGRDRMRCGDLPVRVLKKVSAVAVQHPGFASAQRRRVLAARQAFARSLDPNQSYLQIFDVRVK